MKANHLTCFLAANFSCEMQDSDKIKAFADDCKRSGLELLPPDMRTSGWHFYPEGEKAIRFGLGAVKGTGQKAVEAILKARGENQAEGNTDPALHDLCGLVDPTEVTKLTWEALIKAGSWDWTGSNRGAVLAALDSAVAAGAQAAIDRKAGQMSMFDAFGEGGNTAGESKKEAFQFDERKAWDEQTTLKAEREVLGFYLSGHPLRENAGLLSLLSNTSSAKLSNLGGGAEVMMAGLVVGLAENTIKNGRFAGHKMARFQLEDLDGSVPVTVFPRTLEAVREILVEDTVIVVKAKVEDREDSPALLLEELMNVEQALEHFSGALVVALDARDRAKLTDLKDLCDQRSGQNPLYLDVEGDDGRRRRVRAQSNGVKVCAELVRELDSLLEPGRVSLARM